MLDFRRTVDMQSIICKINKPRMIRKKILDNRPPQTGEICGCYVRYPAPLLWIYDVDVVL